MLLQLCKRAIGTGTQGYPFALALLTYRKPATEQVGQRSILRLTNPRMVVRVEC